VTMASTRPAGGTRRWLLSSTRRFGSWNESGIPSSATISSRSVSTCKSAYRSGEALTIRRKVLIATPEYNHAVPGVLKNALDWASRPVFESCFKNKPVSIVSSSKAFTGGVRAQYQLRETLISMHAHLVMGPEVVVGGVHAKLSVDVYQDQNGLTFMLRSLERLREEILGRRLVYA
jgi:NAD(P)H-dependent FMN reductase